MIEQISREFVPASEEGTNACPVCHHDDHVEKVSSVVRRGSGLIVLPGMGGPQPFVSALAQALSPPDLPSRMTFWGAIANAIGSILIGGFILLMIAGIRSIGVLGVPDGPADVAMIATAFWFGLLIPLVSFGFAARDEARARELTPQYARARSRWEEAYYCSRDDVVFMADGGTTAQPERMAELLMGSPFRRVEGGA